MVTRRAIVFCEAVGSLAFATYAAAECAWVMWATYTTTRTEHAIQRAFESGQACEQAIPDAIQRHVKVWQGSYEKVSVSPVDPAVVIAEGVPQSKRKQV